jgi:hypothetical protein
VPAGNGLAELEDPVEIAATWGDLFFSGQVGGLDWLTMRTASVDLGGTASEADVLDRGGVCAYARALDRAFEDLAWRVGRVEHSEHEVRLDASLEARHTGPLDLSVVDGPTYPASGRRLRLPLQRFCWTVLHKRVFAFEVERGPGLGLGFLARELELEPARLVEAEAKPEGQPGRASAMDPLQAAIEATGGKPRIEDVIEQAEEGLEAPSEDPTSR